jgi:hypothetical protein
MTLLRRAPREVYRVYGEEEFFARVGHDVGFETAAPAHASGGVRLQRIAGAGMLLAATGAVGGLIAVGALSSTAAPRRRVGASLLAGARSLLSGHATGVRVWHPSAGAKDSGSHPSRRDVNSDPRRSRRDAVERRVTVARLVRRAMRARRTTGVRVAAVAERPSPAAAGPSSTYAAAPVTADAVTQAPRAGAAEFGFER